MDLNTRKQRHLFSGPRESAYTTFSPDGERIAFGNGGNGWPAYLIPTAGGDAVHAGDTGERIRGWSRDGRYLLIGRVAGPKTTVGVFDLTTGKAVETLNSELPLGAPVFSADGKWIAFQVDLAMRSKIYIAPFRGSSPVPQSEWISVGPGVVPVFSPDSHSLYFARYAEGSSAASTLCRQPLDPLGHALGNLTSFTASTVRSICPLSTASRRPTNISTPSNAVACPKSG